MNIKNTSNKINEDGLVKSIVETVTRDQSLRNYGDSSSLEGSALSSCLSPKKVESIEILRQQNQLLKREIVYLKSQMNNQTLEGSNKIAELRQQLHRYKKLIEKSYYSLKIIEVEQEKKDSENKSLKLQLQWKNQEIRKLSENSSCMKNYINSIKQNHEKEVVVVWERVSQLQNNLEAALKLMEQDKRDWRNLKTNKNDSIRKRTLSRDSIFY